jgi:Mlc titration factor MtfA (ptsG expression regulator)
LAAAKPPRIVRDSVSRRVSKDHHRATNPAEFFAVITEEFFERSQALKHKHPELYEELSGFFQLDPAELSREPSASAFGGK